MMDLIIKEKLRVASVMHGSKVDKETILLASELYRWPGRLACCPSLPLEFQSFLGISFLNQLEHVTYSYGLYIIPYIEYSRDFLPIDYL